MNYPAIDAITYLINGLLATLFDWFGRVEPAWGFAVLFWGVGLVLAMLWLVTMAWFAPKPRENYRDLLAEQAAKKKAHKQ
jgi:hypothetical protein